jgi:ferredoxin-thioredoxin reductase catalytic subunit
MFFGDVVKCSASKNPTNTSTMATITASSNYWNAMALETTPGAFQQEKKKYGYDDCGVKCRINTGNNEDDWQPCQPWCMTCGYPPHICDEYTTRCTGTKIGRWFNEEKGEWIEAEPLTTEEQEEEDRWNQYKFRALPHLQRRTGR